MYGHEVAHLNDPARQITISIALAVWEGDPLPNRLEKGVGAWVHRGPVTCCTDHHVACRAEWTGFA